MSESMDSANELNFEDAHVFWTDDELESYRGAVTIHENGWVEIRETAEYFPPHAVSEVSV